MVRQAQLGFAFSLPNKKISKHSFKFSTFLFCITILTITTTSARSSTAGDEADRLSLLAFKSKIVHDPEGILNLWNGSLHFCDWTGVTCGRKHRRVTALDLSSSGLVGSLSSYIGNLSFIRSITLQNNTLGGEIPREIGQLFRLQVLHLANNSLVGEIPAANLSRCTRLWYLNLGRNNLVGKIPTELESLKNLQDLGLHFNHLTGGVPQFLANLSSLEVLSLSYNSLGGNIPDSLGRLHKLTKLSLAGNDLFGTIPQSIYNLSTMSIFALSQNRLRGSLPTNLGLVFPHLTILQLSENSFQGPIPFSLSKAYKLEVIEVYNNSFSGKVTVDFGGMKNLSYLNLGLNNFGSGEADELSFLNSLTNCSYLQTLTLNVNRFEGVLPDSIGNLSTDIELLILNTNQLYGRIPSGIGNLVNLFLLGMEFNNFTGPIPTELGKLRKLQWFALRNNNLSGKIPPSLGNLSSLMELHLQRNYLEGNIPSSLGDCKSLLVLNLYDNNLNGMIPKKIFEITHLSVSLDLAQNNLTGSVPKEIGDLKDLMEFDISENKLSGEIPRSVGDCTMLEELYMQGNDFEGLIPSTLSYLRGIRIIDLSRNNLSGTIPESLQASPVKKLNLSFNHFMGHVPTSGVFGNASSISVVGNSNLCGGILELKLPVCSKSNGSKIRKKWIIIPCVFLGLFIAGFLLFCWFKNKKLQQSLEFPLRKSFFQVSYNKLLKATNEFSLENLVGTGSFGSVYKGILDPQQGNIVAVKVFNLQNRGASKSFMAECRALRSIRHRNLVRVITACSSIDFHGNDFKALVYEFMPNGSLEKWLHDSPVISNEADHVEVGNRHRHRHLSLLQRVNIALDIASALDYLHHNYYKPIVHCDLKPSNILLDQEMTARVGDFGLAKFLNAELANVNHSSSIGVRGTIGYTPPEYGLGSEVSTKGDVYSYGIILLEMMTGKRPTDPMFVEELDLHNYVRSLLPNRVMETIDPKLLASEEEEETVSTRRINQTRLLELEQARARSREECVIAIIKIGVACSLKLPQDRMDMTEVIRELQLVRNILCGIHRTRG